MQKKNRPLAPHLTIYKGEITSIVSIFHRISGFVLAFSFILSMCIMYFDILYSEYYFCYNLVFTYEIYTSWLFLSIGYLVLVIISFHFCNGIRHLIWDLGYGLDMKNVSITGLVVLSVACFVIFILVL